MRALAAEEVSVSYWFRLAVDILRNLSCFRFLISQSIDPRRDEQMRSAGTGCAATLRCSAGINWHQTRISACRLMQQVSAWPGTSTWLHRRRAMSVLRHCGIRSDQRALRVSRHRTAGPWNLGLGNGFPIPGASPRGCTRVCVGGGLPTWKSLP
jgi:hypothetical protein